MDKISELLEILTRPEILTAIFTGIFASVALGGVFYKIIKRPRLEFGAFIKKDNWYYLVVKKNKRGKIAKNCRCRLKLGKDYNADSRWGSSRLKECDMHDEEHLKLFTIKSTLSEVSAKELVKTLCFLEGAGKGEPVATTTRGKNTFPVIDERRFSLLNYENEILTISLTSENAKTPKPIEIKISEIISKARK